MTIQVRCKVHESPGPWLQGRFISSSTGLNKDSPKLNTGLLRLSVYFKLPRVYCRVINQASLIFRPFAFCSYHCCVIVWIAGETGITIKKYVSWKIWESEENAGIEENGQKGEFVDLTFYSCRLDSFIMNEYYFSASVLHLMCVRHENYSRFNTFSKVINRPGKCSFVTCWIPKFDDLPQTVPKQIILLYCHYSE